ncbi:unnamed protein product, partial [Rotaria magnacalcarata]
YETLNFNDEFDDMCDEREIDSEDDDYVKNQYVEMSIFQPFNIDCKQLNQLIAFQGLDNISNGMEQGMKSWKKIKEFMFDEFYVKRAIEKEAVHDTD